MNSPLLYRQLQDQLRQWVRPKDERHLQGTGSYSAIRQRLLKSLDTVSQSS
ncbi:MAG: hypothetical protein AAGE59_37195 [Cyanobacteria bacterium P01_F01_bin.86]